MSNDGKRFEIWSGDTRIAVDRSNEALYKPCGRDVRAQTHFDKVQILIGDKMLEMTTVVAVKLGLALNVNASACIRHGDVVLLEIGGVEFTLPPWLAAKFGGLICKKADKADDFQRAQRTHT